MSVLLDLPRETELALIDRAEREGVPVPQVILHLLQQALDASSPLNTVEEPDGDPLALERAMELYRRRTPEEIAKNREQILAASTPVLHPPTGKTITEMVVGKWPGKESDAEISTLLEQLS